jgi:hypothetical protein
LALVDSHPRICLEMRRGLPEPATQEARGVPGGAALAVKC